MAPIAGFAVWYDGTLIQLLKLKFELLIQCVPAFYLGVHFSRLKANAVITGVVAGLAVTLGLSWSDWLGFSAQSYKQVWGFHAGVVGLAVNLAVCFAGLLWEIKRPRPSSV